MPYTATSGASIMTAAEAKGKNTNSIMQGWVDRCPWEYYDTLTLFPGSALLQQYTPFSVAIGQIDPLTNLPKTELQTNMRRGNQFPPPNCLLLNSISVYFESNWIKADIDLMLQNYLLKFYIDEKYYHNGYLWWFPQGAGLSGLSTQTGESVYNNGLPAPGYRRLYGPWSKYIAPEQQFGMYIQWYQSASAFGTASTTPPTLAVGGTVRIVLDGFTDRSVQ